MFNFFKKKEADSVKVIELNKTENGKVELKAGDSTDKVDNKEDKTSNATEDNVTTCPKCKQTFNKQEIKDNLNVCIACGHHYVISADKRMRSLVDKGTFKPLKCKVAFTNPLEYPDYEDKILSLQEKTGLDEAVLAGTAKIDGYDAVIAVMSSKFLMGSMGTVVGEKIALLAEYAGKKKLPLIIFSASGGARMQEGILSLMQMARTTTAINKLKEKNLPYIVILTDPTTGGVSASFAMIGDIHIAETGSIIGFAGQRVIEKTIREKLPEGFQRAEYLREHGMVDIVVKRPNLKETLVKILKVLLKK